MRTQVELCGDDYGDAGEESGDEGCCEGVRWNAVLVGSKGYCRPIDSSERERERESRTTAKAKRTSFLPPCVGRSPNVYKPTPLQANAVRNVPAPNPVSFACEERGAATHLPAVSDGRVIMTTCPRLSP